MALTKANYLGVPDVGRQFNLDLRAVTRLAECSTHIRAIKIKDRIYIDMDHAAREAESLGLTLTGLFHKVARFSRQ